MSETWYEVAEADSPLTQGDLIFDCPLVAWDTVALQSVGRGSAEVLLKDCVGAFREDVVVMTQACDLEHRKVENVVLCPHLALSAFRGIWQDWMTGRKQNPSAKAWQRTCEDIAAGYVWNQAFLDRSDHPGLATEIRVVDFHEVFTVPRIFLEAVLQRRQAPRLRLLPPYREHLAQAFARFFMRVGLPQPIDPAW
jgi:hypothetical protein